MKIFTTITFFLSTLLCFGQVTNQECANVFSPQDQVFSYDGGVVLDMFTKYFLTDYVQIDENHEMASKVQYEFFFRFPDNPGSINGKPLIAKSHVEKIRIKLWNNSQYPSQSLNGFGVNSYINNLQKLGSSEVYKLPFQTLDNGYSYYASNPTFLDLYLGGESNFPENDIFNNLRLTIFVYVKPQFANLYPGGVNNNIYLMDWGTADSDNGVNYIERSNFTYMLNDDDGDGIFNDEDLCPENFDPSNADSDGDGDGDICDNCPQVANSNQLDTDNDGIGNVCDDDDDDDGILDVNDKCPLIASSNNLDTDSDGVGDICDNCVSNSNSNQHDIDNDGIGNVCDSDIDGDGMLNSEDNCPEVAGILSNNGCPGLPDLIIDVSNSNTVVPGSGNSTTSLSSSIIEQIYIGNEIQFNLKIKNEGVGNSGTFKVGFYLSTDNNIANSNLLLDQNFSNINENSTATQNIAISHWHFANLLGILDNAYIHIKVDIDGDVDEGSNESNNSFSSRRVYIHNTAGRFAYLNIGNNILIEVPLDQYFSSNNRIRQIKTRYNMKIYKFDTLNLVTNMSVVDGSNVDLSNLPYGKYIIHINDNYVKQFKKLTSGIGILIPN